MFNAIKSVLRVFFSLFFLATGINQSWSQSFVSTNVAPFNTPNFSSYVIDYNNDGLDDVVGWIVNVPNSHKLWRNNGNGTFADVSVSQNFPVAGGNPADFDKNGFTDIFQFSGDTLNIFFSNAAGFTNPTPVCGIFQISTLFNLQAAAGNGPITFSDINKDGIYDLIYMQSTDTAIYYWAKRGKKLCNGCGFAFESAPATKILTVKNAASPLIKFADVNNDGAFDLLLGVGSPANGNLSGYFNYAYSIYLNNGSGVFNFSPNTGYNIGRASGFGQLGEFNNDGITDIFSGAADCCEPINYLYTHFSNGPGSYTASVDAMQRDRNNEYYYQRSSVVDVNLDRRQDILWTYIDAYFGSSALQCYLNNGNNTFTESAAALGIKLGTSPTVVSHSTQASTMLDINNDKRPDLNIQSYGTYAPNTFFNNYTLLNQTSNQAVKIKLTGCSSLKEGWGARLKYKSAGTWSYQQHNGYANSGYPFLYLGLGPATTIDSLVVNWTSGAVSTFLNLRSGNYYELKETDNCNISAAGVIVNEVHKDVSCRAVNSGSVTISASGGTPPYTGTGTFTGLVKGSYVYTVFDATGCTGSVNVTIGEVPKPTASASYTPIDIATGLSRVTVRARGGTAPYLYSLNGGITTQADSIFNLTIGDYNISIIDSFGCVTSVPVIIKVDSTTAGLFLNVRQNEIATGNKHIVQILDFDNDFDDDLIIHNNWPAGTKASPDPRGYQLWRNNGAGNYSPVVNNAGIIFYWGFRKARNYDLDNNGYTDLLMESADKVRLYLNFSGVFKDATDSVGLIGGKYDSLFAIPQDSVLQTKVADVNNDGIFDLVFLSANAGRNVVSACLGAKNCRIGLQYERPIELVSTTERLALFNFADIDNDFDQDILLAIRPTPDRVPSNDFFDQPYAVFLNNGTGNFIRNNASGFSIGRYFSFATAADFNGDSRTDLLSGSADCCQQGNPLRTWFSNNSLPLSVNDSAMLRVGNPYYDGAVPIDMDLDGMTDVIWKNLRSTGFPANQGARVQYFRNNGDESFTESAASLGINYGSTGNCCPIDVSTYASVFDCNSDGRPDIFIESNSIDSNSINQQNRWLLLNTFNRNVVNIRLQACVGVRDGEGARIRYKAGGNWYTKLVANSTLNDEVSADYLVLGIGQEKTIDTLFIDWVGGNVTVHTALPAGSKQTLFENTSCYARIDFLNFNPFKGNITACGKEQVLNAGPGFESYRWSTGDSTQTITVRQSGEYHCIVTKNGCVSSDTVLVSILENVFQFSDTTICAGSVVRLGSIGNSDTLAGFLGPYFFNGHRYYFSDNSDFWDSARVRANNAGGYLAVINSAAENTFIENTAVFLGKLGQLWLGATDQQTEGTWLDINNDPLSYTNWAIGEPNDLFNEDYLLMYTGGNLSGQWNDGQAISQMPYVIEINQPGSGLTYQWSTGDSTSYVDVSPDSTTTYYVRVSDGIGFCDDTLTIIVDQINRNFFAADTQRVCEIPFDLTAGFGNDKYLWNTGDTIETISISQTGWYSCSIEKGVCRAQDSVFMILLDVSISANDSNICIGDTVTLTAGVSQESPLTDIDGNVYPTVNIGGVTWMQKNLCVTRYNNGDSIPRYEVPNWAGLNSPGRYDDTFQLRCDRLGSLYNWYAVNDSRGMAPIGWHIATNTDWNRLTKYLDPSADTSCQNCYPSLSAGGPLKDTGTAFWQSPNIGATNASGFSCLPTGGIYDGFNLNCCYVGYFWTSSSLDNSTAITRSIYNDSAQLRSYNDFRRYGFGVRAVKDITSSTPRYQWSTGDTTPTIRVNPVVTTTYSVTVNNGISSCTESFTVFVNENNFNPFRDTTVVCDTSAVLDAGRGYASYLWNTGATTRTIATKTAGYYSVRAINSNGCSFEDETYLKLLSVPLQVPALPDTVISCDSSYTLDAGGGYAAYIWSTGETGRSITVNNSGTYTVTVFNIEGCSVSASSLISLLYIDIDQDSLTICRGDSTQLTTTLISKTASSRGKEFWVGYGHHQSMEGNNNQDMKLYFHADQKPANVDVYVFDNNTGTMQLWNRFSIPQNTSIATPPLPKAGTNDTRLFSLPCETIAPGVNAPCNSTGIFNRGIQIISDQPIAAYSHIFSSTNSGASLLIPAESWGNAYLTLNSNQQYAENCYSWVYVVSAQDNSSVEIIPSQATRDSRQFPSVSAGAPFRVNLNKGQVFQFMAAGAGAIKNNLTGTIVRSVPNNSGIIHPVAVFSGSSRTSSPQVCGSGGGDNDIQQCFPLAQWGKRYLTAPFSTALSSANNPVSLNASVFTTNSYKILVNDSNTVVKRNGIPLSRNLLQSGTHYIIPADAGQGMNEPQLFEADKPVMIAQYMHGGNCLNNSLGDPEMVYLTPIDNGVKSASFVRSNETSINANYVTLIIPKKGLPTLRINDSSSFNYILTHPRDTGYYIVVKGWQSELTAGKITCDYPFTGITYGLGPVESYAYNLGKVSSDAEGVRYLWSTGDTTANISVKPTVSTTYYVTVTRGLNVCQDSVRVTVKPNLLNPNFIPQDTIKVCGSDYNLQIGGSYASYLWNTGATTSSINITQTGQYSCKIGDGVCYASDTSFVSILDAGIVNNDTTVCSQTPLTLTTRRSANSIFTTPLKDIDNNTYNTVVINDQIWMGENLKVSRYSNGDPIPNLTDDSAWSVARYGAWSNYNHDPVLGTVYGKLYNAYAALDSRGIAPKGWRIPNAADWKKLVKYLDPAADTACPGCIDQWIPSRVAGGSLKDTGINYWLSPNSGASNISGFKALGAGTRLEFGPFQDLNNYTTFYNSQPFFDTSWSWFQGLSSQNSNVYFDRYFKQNGRSIRLIRNQPAITYLWSTGDTTASISVRPNTTTTYYVTISNGITSCTDSVKVTVTPNPIAGNILTQDTIKACGDNYILNATGGFSSYLWNTGSTASFITATSSGLYSVRVSNGNCQASDSVYLSLINPIILPGDTTICESANLVLSGITTGNLPLGCSSLPTNLLNGLIGYYPFCGNANDESGNGRSGVVNGASLTFDRFGNPNAAYQFGTSSDIQLSNTAGLNNYPMSVSLWYNAATALVNSGNTVNLFSKYSSSTGNGYGLVFADQTASGGGRGALPFYLTSTGRILGLSGGPAFGQNGALAETWYHVTFTADNSGGKLYVNGQLAGSLPWSGTPGSSSNAEPWKIGGLLGSWFEGRLDDIAVFNRVLTPLEVQQLYSISNNAVNSGNLFISYQWSTGSQASSITVSPVATTDYWLQVSNGIHTCRDTVRVNVINSTFSTTNADICPSQLPYFWNGNFYNSAGVYQITLLNSRGCDSILTLNLNVKQDGFSFNDTTVCLLDFPLTYKGIVFNAGGTYNISFTAANGCDSIAIYAINTFQNPVKNQNVRICQGQSYLWGGRLLTTGGIYTDTIDAVLGCDTLAFLNLTVSPVSSTTQFVTVCSGNLPYIWNGVDYYVSGSYTRILKNIFGCDSTVTLNLTVNQDKRFITNITLCSDATPYFWNNNFYFTSSVDSIVLTASNGCDSVDILRLTVNPVNFTIDTVAICDNELPYLWNGNIYTEGGAYSTTLVNSLGCDSIVALILDVNPRHFDTSVLSICANQLPFTWRGQVLTQAGTYRDTTKDEFGCDSNFVLFLSVLPSSASTIKDTICQNETPYLWAGGAASSSGFYQVVIANQFGCDSVITLFLEVKPLLKSLRFRTICTNELPFTWNNRDYYVSTRDTVIFRGSNGCDSLAILTLTVLENDSITVNARVCANDLPYNYNGKSYFNAGTYLDLLPDTTGCDTVVTLNLIVDSFYQTIDSVTVCNNQLPYSWRGGNLFVSGIYSDSLNAINGCDSIISLFLTVNDTTLFVLDTSICENSLPLVWNNNNIAFSGTYTFLTTGSNGCDSTTILNLLVRNTVVVNIDSTICSSSLPFIWNNISIGGPGSYTFTTTGANGCDSVTVLNLVINLIQTSFDSAFVCAGQTYFWNGNPLSSSGFYSDTLVGSNGCDSIATLNLQLLDTFRTVLYDTICAGASYVWNGSSYFQSGIYLDTVNTVAGCDSVLELHLKVNDTVRIIILDTICSGRIYSWNGNNYAQSGSYLDSFKTINGCDSILELRLAILPYEQKVDSFTVCSNSLPFSWRGGDYDSAGVYIDTIPSAVGCDTIATLFLTVNAVDSTSDTITVCDSQLPYLWNGNNLDTAGFYLDTLVNGFGCDSIVTLQLNVNVSSSRFDTVIICANQLPYAWIGGSATAAGDYLDTLVNSVGCDSFYHLNLVVNPVDSIMDSISVCVNQLPYSWRGVDYAIGGVYFDTLSNRFGCDSVRGLTLTVEPLLETVDSIAVCSNTLPYNWRGVDFTAAGTYYDTIPSAVGCDTVAILVLTVNNVDSTSDTIRVCDSQLPYVWNANNLDTAGFYRDTLVNRFGCDSIVTLRLIVNVRSSQFDTVIICANQLPYAWVGGSATAAGDYLDTLVNSVGCDSLYHLNLVVNPVDSIMDSVSVCVNQLPYNWRGVDYATGGVYFDTLSNRFGCDSVRGLILTVEPLLETVDSITVCSITLPYNWRGTDFTAAGTYYDTIPSSIGCDTLRILVLTVNAIDSTSDTITVCDSQLPYLWNGNILDTAGFYLDTLVNGFGCDSIVTLRLNVNFSSSQFDTITICANQLPYAWVGGSATAAGDYLDTLVNSVGCDSLYHLNLVVNRVDSVVDSVNVCINKLPYNWNGVDIFAGGVYMDTFINTLGCDSMVNLILTVDSLIRLTDSVRVCSNQLPYQWENGQSYSLAGIYTDTFPSSVTCDTLRTLVLTVNSADMVSDTVSVCQNQLPYLWNSRPLNTTGIYVDSLVNQYGCDSIVTLTFIVNPVYTVNLSDTVCESALPYVWNGINYTNSGIYPDTLISINGCDSIVILNLTVFPDPSGVFNLPLWDTICQGSPALLIASGADSYQWYYNGGQVPGAVSDTFYAANAGNYKVEFINNTGCRKMSDIEVYMYLLVKPEAAFTYEGSCAENPVVFSNNSNVGESGAVSYQWNYGDGTSGNLFEEAHNFSTPGNYTVSLVVNSVSCPQLVDTVIQTLNIEVPPTPLNYPPVNAIKNIPTLLTARDGGESYVWRTGDGLDDSTLQKPTLLNPVTERLFTITITDSAGCVVVDTQRVFIFTEYSIQMPQAFTPNGDGKNDYLYPFLVGIREFRYFRVYNRWGNLLYESRNIMPGWNGTYKGMPQPTETYIWIAEGVDVDGKTIRSGGNTLLIR